MEPKAVGFERYVPLDKGNGFFAFPYEPERPRGHDLVVAVEASSFNPTDLVHYKTPLAKENTPSVLGFDGFGTVVRTGPQVVLFKPGDKVFFAGDQTRRGSFADLEAIDERIVALAPSNITPAQASSIPLAFITAWESLVEKMGIDPRETAVNKEKSVLIVNASGGVGSIAVQLAKAFGLKVIATAGRKETAEWASSNGADYVLNHRMALSEQLTEKGLGEVDFILDLYGPDDRFSDFVTCLKPMGKIVSIGKSSADLPLYLLKKKAATFAWEWMFAKSTFRLESLSTQHQILATAKQMAEEGKIRPRVTRVIKGLNPESVREGLTSLGHNDTIGKIVLVH